MNLSNSRRNSYRPLRFYALLVGIFLLIISGVAYRYVQAELSLLVDKPIKLKVALSNFPMAIGPWEGQDIPIPIATQRVAGNDDFVSRVYVNSETGQWVNLYIAFSARPRTMLGHRPQVCYPANGWQLERTDRIEIIRQSGQVVPCQLHRFMMPEPSYDKTIVLNYYILNGVITDDESDFSGLSGRSPNIQGHLANYVVQVQISAPLEKSVRIVAEKFTDLILDYFPDTDGLTKISPAIGVE